MRGVMGLADPVRAAEARIRVAIVDDSVVVRGLFSRWLSEVADVDIVGIHRNGVEAVRQVGLTKPDIIILDIEMPEMDGLTALPLLLHASPASRVLVVSSMSIRGADVTLRCLMRGATDYLPKPSGMREVTTSVDFRAELVQRVQVLGRRKEPSSTSANASGPDIRPVIPIYPFPAEQDVSAVASMPPDLPAHGTIALRASSPVPPRLIVIGASTGGPQAVASLLAAAGPALRDLPVVVVQHMPATFTMLFADHLRRQAGLDAVEIGGGEMLHPGRIHVVRGGQNLILTASGGRFLARRFDGPPPGRWMPSVDLLLASASDVAGRNVLALVLTGMGDDGLRGAQAIVQAGGTVMVQDEASSAVWGMPAVVARAGLASAIVDLPTMASLIHQQVQKPS